MRILLAILTFIALVVTDMLGVSTSVALGLSLKNLLLYIALLTVLVDTTLKPLPPLAAIRHINQLFLAFVVWATLSWGYTLLNPESLQYARQGVNLLGFANLKSNLLDHFIFFIVFFYSARNVIEVRFLLKIVLFLVFLGNLISILDAFGYGPGIIKQLASDGRIYGPIGEPNSYAAFILLFLPAYFGLMFYPSWRVRAMNAVAVLTALATLLLTGSRGGIVGFVGGTLFAWFLLGKLFKWKDYARLLPTALAGMFIAIAVVSVKYADLLESRVEATTQSDLGKASSGRLDIWTNSLEVMHERPASWIFGIGWNRFGTYSEGIAAHNTYLDHLFNLGTVGLGIYGVLIILVVKLLARAAKKAEGGDRTLLIASVFGLCATFAALFFVTMYAPWYFIWAYIGSLSRLAYFVIRDPTYTQQEILPASSAPPRAIPIGLRRQSV